MTSAWPWPSGSPPFFGFSPESVSSSPAAWPTSASVNLTRALGRPRSWRPARSLGRDRHAAGAGLLEPRAASPRPRSPSSRCRRPRTDSSVPSAPVRHDVALSRQRLLQVDPDAALQHDHVRGGETEGGRREEKRRRDAPERFSLFLPALTDRLQARRLVCMFTSPPCMSAQSMISPLDACLGRIGQPAPRSCLKSRIGAREL